MHYMDGPAPWVDDELQRFAGNLVWRGGPRGNREYLDRMDQLGLADCLRYAQGTLTPTFRTPSKGTITAQIDYLFVTDMLRTHLVTCDTGSRQRVFEQGLSDHLPIIADFV